MQTKTKSLPIADGLIMYLYSAGDTGGKYVRLDFNDYTNYKDYAIIVDRSKLSDIADFIYKYLENN